MSNDDHDAAISQQITRIRAKLQAVIDSGLRPVGCGRHGFRLRPCAPPGEIELFESLCRVTLPPGYRRFISEVSDGGAGPAYGLLSLGAGVAYDPGAVIPDLLPRPFPHTQSADAPRDPETGRHEPRPGSITLCDEGGGPCHFLVVTGPTRGTMWIDRTRSGGGYAPLGVDFLTWYERWLDDALAGGNGLWWHPRDAGR